MKRKSVYHLALLTLMTILAAALQGCDIVDILKGLAPDVELTQICYSANTASLWLAFKNNSTVADLKNASFGFACSATDNITGKIVNQTIVTSVMSLGKGLGTSVKLSPNLNFPNSSTFVPGLWVKCGVEYSYTGLSDPKPSNNIGEVFIYSNSNGCFTPSAPQNHTGGGVPAPPPPLPLQPPVQVQGQTQPGQLQPGQPNPEQLQPIQPLPAQPQPELPQPAQPQPEQPQPIQPQPVQPQPVQPQPSQPQPSTSGQSSQSGCGGAPLVPYFNANPASIFSGQSSTLSWGNITNGKTGPLVRSVKIDPGLGEVGSGASSRTVKPTKTTTFTLTATGCGGTAKRQVIVTVFH